MSYINKKHIATGVTWVTIEEADLFLCCGCPADTVKHLKNSGIIQSIEIDGVKAENGPNAILLSDTLIQNGQVSSLAEYPILHMLYLQGTNVPNHPNYQKWKPTLIGHREQIEMQLGYVSVGNHGLSTLEEIMEGGLSFESAKKIFETKLHYSNGKITPMHELVDSCDFDGQRIEVKRGVEIRRIAINEFQISYKDQCIDVNLNIQENEHFTAPYSLPFKNIIPGKFSITHSGEGNGWDQHRPCMASVIHCNNRIYLIDAGPNVLNNLSYLGIGLSEIDGIFLSHIHDDHFAGITELLNVERKLNFYATRLIRLTAEKKLKALMNSEQDLLHTAFNCQDLEFNEWTSINGLEAMPFYSPHTVETSTFNFRVLDQEGYKTYTHLSDTINLEEFRKIIHESPDIFSNADYEQIKNSYLTKVNLKKVDVGGGQIHGNIMDYAEDKSDMIVLAHTSKILRPPKENFTNVAFGTTHILIEDKDKSFFKNKSKTYLKHYFNMLDDVEIDELANGKIMVFAPGDHIVSRENTSTIYLIISGIVKCENAKGTQHTLDAGNFLGYSKRYFRADLPDGYAAWSYVYCIVYDEHSFSKFILKAGLIDAVKSRISMMQTLRNSIIINDLLSNSIINWISKHAQEVIGPEYILTEEQLQKHLFLIRRGSVTITYDEDKKVVIGEHEHFGGMELMYEYRKKQQFFIDDELEAVSISVDILKNIPKFLWRLLELEDKRFQQGIFEY